MRFEGKAAIVTGAARGIGRATAELLHNDGAQVLVNFRTNEAAATALVEQLNSVRQNSAVAFRADVGDPDEVRAMIARCLEAFGRVDILVNNAGYVQDATILDHTDAIWRETMRANLDGPFYCIREVAPYMVQQRSGAIVSISSIAAYLGGVNSAAYTASKAAVIALTRKISLELAQYGIRVNAVAPGGTETEMVRDRVEALRKLHPMGRLAQPGEIAAVIAFLCSDEASFITGECVKVAGGR